MGKNLVEKVRSFGLVLFLSLLNPYPFSWSNEIVKHKANYF